MAAQAQLPQAPMAGQAQLPRAPMAGQAQLPRAPQAQDTLVAVPPMLVNGRKTFAILDLPAGEEMKIRLNEPSDVAMRRFINKYKRSTNAGKTQLLFETAMSWPLLWARCRMKMRRDTIRVRDNERKRLTHRLHKAQINAVRRAQYQEKIRQHQQQQDENEDE